MSRYLIEFWPALLPISLYLFWLSLLRKEKTRQKLTSGPLFWTIISSALLIIACFLYWSSHQSGSQRGIYVPPNYKPGGKVTSGGVTYPAP
jgi:hypothetical protein